MAKLILAKITMKQYELLEYIKKDLPFGRCELITHNGEPDYVENPRQRKFFGPRVHIHLQVKKGEQKNTPLDSPS